MNREEAFWAKVDKRGFGDCWQWNGTTSGKYGKFSRFWAHRYAYALAVGPIAEKLTIDHLCRNTLCVNPHHMEVVSYRENNLRGDSPTAKNARKTHCHKGHPYSGENVQRVSTDSRRICRRCQMDRMIAYQNRLTQESKAFGISGAEYRRMRKTGETGPII